MKLPVHRMHSSTPTNLHEDPLELLGTSAHVPFVTLGATATRIHETANERRGISADSAERLARHFDDDAVSC